MEIENSPTGILSEQDAVAQLQAARASDKPTGEEQATPDVEAEDETEELEAEQVEEEAVEAEGEAQDDEEAEATTQEGDTGEDIDADELERGYLRQADYTRKTQELAAERAQMAQERQAFQAQAQQAMQQAKALMERYTVPTEQEPNWLELSQQLEPKQFQHKQAEWQAKQQKAKEAQQIHAQLMQQQHEQTRQTETARLMEKLPEWQDPSIQKRDVQAIVDIGAEIGVSPEEIGAMTDHRMLLALHRLAQAKVAKTVAATKKVTAKPRVKSGAAPKKVDKAGEALRAAEARLKKSNSPKDAAEVMRLKRQAKVA